MKPVSTTDATSVLVITGLLAGLVAAAWLVVVLLHSLVKGRGCEETEPDPIAKWRVML